MLTKSSLLNVILPHLPADASSGPVKKQKDATTYSQRFQNPRSAKKYARRFDHGSRKRSSDREIETARAAIAAVPGWQSIIDVPCGAGRLIPALMGEGRQVTGFDISEELLGHARSAHVGVVDFKLADITNLPLADASVDGVFCNRLLHHLPGAGERLRVLRELRRVARAHLVVSFFDYHRFACGREILRWLKNPRRRSDPVLPKLAEFCQELRATGWEPVSIRRVGRFFGSQHFITARAVPTPVAELGHDFEM